MGDFGPGTTQGRTTRKLQRGGGGGWGEILGKTQYKIKNKANALKEVHAEQKWL